MRLTDIWKDFFIAAAGASGTLVGLVIVAISVNIQRILEHPQLPSRGGAAVGSLMLVLISSLLWLLPQPKRVLGGEILLCSFLAWMLQLWSARHMIRAFIESRRPFCETLAGITISQIQVLPFVIGGFGFLLGHNSSAYWIAFGSISALALSVLNAWILLVEILR
jgi:modulator of FtsH protease